MVHLSTAATAQPAGGAGGKADPAHRKAGPGLYRCAERHGADPGKNTGAVGGPVAPQIKAELEAAAKKHGFKDFNDYDEVTANITMVMTGIDSKTKVFTEPAIAIKEEIQEVTANKALPAEEKKQMLEELNEALKSAQPIQFPSNIELVKKHYDKIDAALN